MTHVGLFACYAGLLASAAAPHFSLALSLRSGTAASQQNSLRTDLFASGEDSPPTPPAAEEKTEDCLVIINKLRGENLKDLLGTLTKAEQSEVTESLKKIGETDLESPTPVKIAVALAGNNVETCESGGTADAKTYPGLVVPFAHDTEFNCNALIQETYTAGLDHLKPSNFDPSTGTYNAENAPFNNVAASNVAFLLSEKSKKVSCAATKDCTAGHDVLFCYFIEPLRTGDKPFTAVAPDFSSALSLRSGTGTSQQNGLSSNLFTSERVSVRTEPAADEITKDCLDIINKLRKENLKGLLGTLTKADDTEVTAILKTIEVDSPANLTAAKIAEMLAGNDIESCESGKSANAKTHPGFVIPFAHDTEFKCNALIQATYTAGLDHLKQSNFEPSTGAYDVENAPFNNVDASNVAFLLSAKSSKVSCAATNNCNAGHNVLFCYFIEPLRKGDKSFTTELYNALWGLETGAAFTSVPTVATVLFVLALIIRI
ncbi:SAG family member [Eimeria necatrix]|uniref:SAG family member n=1 Tax=Eimeria necatrix TaxID=51315 RepID=U6N1L6_9EIME|nr:SAG family member [Eimeria necatrix]CDJ70087.1 SAG family member [Eimeria necatrix]